MKQVASADNALFRSLLALSRQAAAVRRLDQAWLEGLHLSAAALDAGLQPLALVCTEAALGQPQIAALAGRVPRQQWVLLSEALFGKLSPLPSGPRVGLLVRRPRPRPRPGVAVVLDRLQDAGNVGTVLRTAAASGAGTVYCLRGCAGAWTPKVLRAAMGAHFAIAVVEDLGWDEIREQLPRPWITTAADARSDLYELELPQACTWVFGNEGAGVDAAIAAACDLRVRIPQPGAVESLNVAAAAAICLYEGLRQRRRGRFADQGSGGR